MAKDFSLALTPHRSLTREGFVALMVIFGALNFAAGLFFFIAGAWPIVGFMGLDVVLLWLAFRWNYRDASRAEHIVAHGDEVVLRRFARTGAETVQRFNRSWLCIVLEHDADRDIPGRLFLRSHGESFEIASFLGREERVELARELRNSL